MLDLLAEQHPVRQIGQSVVMRKVGDLLVGAAAVGYIVNDVDDVARFAAFFPDTDTFGGDEALAQPPGLPWMFVQEYPAVGVQCPLVIERDDIGGCFRKEIGSR